jgi:hypothetical protein
MQDVYLPIADVLARPLRVKRRCGAVIALYQLWRADFAALARLALTCREASMATKRLLWTCTQLGERERARRAQVRRVRAFMRLPTVATLLVSTSWTGWGRVPEERFHIRSRTSVTFNGRVRMREQRFDGQRLRRQRRAAPATIRVGLTLTKDTRQSGRVLVWIGGDTAPFRTGAFTEYDGALGVLKRLTYLGRWHWEKCYERFRWYDAPSLGANWQFETIVVPDRCW